MPRGREGAASGAMDGAASGTPRTAATGGCADTAPPAAAVVQRATNRQTRTAHAAVPFRSLVTRLQTRSRRRCYRRGFEAASLH
jgi:hypothetical protein